MQITDIKHINPPLLAETNGKCTVCRGHEATLRITVDQVWSIRICKWCIKLVPEQMLILMKQEREG